LARPEIDEDDDDENDDDEKGVEWEIQKRGTVVQCIVWGDYNNARRRRELCVRTEDARTEIAALQYIANQHRYRRCRSSGGIMDTIIEQYDNVHDNLRPIMDVLQDDVQWWIITPMSTAAKEDLFTLAQKSVFTDTTARFWFRQVLRVRFYIYYHVSRCVAGTKKSPISSHTLVFFSWWAVHWLVLCWSCLSQAVTNLHRVGICHRNLGLESFLLQDDQDVAILSDFEFACRIPYGNSSNTDGGNGVDAVDVGYPGSSSSSRPEPETMRRLIVPEKICGKPLYLAPECWCDVPFDGVAIDVWAMGTMLLVMLTGSDPWGVARPSDGWYNCIVVEGRLEEALRLRLGGRRILSASAIDLLKRILRVDPRDRPSLYEVQHHPWVLGGNGD
jgi:serine/threonine protein kinase